MLAQSYEKKIIKYFGSKLPTIIFRTKLCVLFSQSMMIVSFVILINIPKKNGFGFRWVCYSMQNKMLNA